MTHSDDNGLVLPPKIAPLQVVIVPIYKKTEQLEQITEYVQPIIKGLQAKGITVKFDNDNNKTPGWKFNEYELKGVPVRIAVGPRDMNNRSVEIARRDTLDKKIYPVDNAIEVVSNLLEQIQNDIFQRALDYRQKHTYYVDTWDEFQQRIQEGGFVVAHWDGTEETEARIKELTKATIRVLPVEEIKEQGKDLLTGKPSQRRVIFARAY